MRRSLLIGLAAYCLLGMLLVLSFLLYGWYFQQMANRLEQARIAHNDQPPLVKPLALTQVALPEPPPVQQIKPQATAKAAAPLKQSIRQESRFRDHGKTLPTVDVSNRAVAETGSEAEAEPTPDQLLQQVEAGNGPSIEIAWPRALAKRQQLFNVLTDHLGVQLGVLVKESVYPLAGDLKPYSRLVRVVSGIMLPQERRLYQSSRYSGLPVRLFPRVLDARLLAGIGLLSQTSLTSLKSVRGVYMLQGRQLLVQQLMFDGQAVDGQVLLAKWP